MKFIDISGLTRSPHAERLADILELEGARLRTEQERLDLLRQLRQGAGVTVYTGPLGAPFWALASLEVKVKVEPDGYDWEQRTEDVREWSYLAAGCDEAEARSLAAREKPPTPKHHLYEKWAEGERLRKALESSASAKPLIVQEYEVEVIRDASAQIGFIDSLNTGHYALDFEWETNSGRTDPVGLSISDGCGRNLYLPVRYRGFASGHGSDLREAVKRLLDRGVPTVWHNAKADLQTQYPADPLELSGKPIDDTIVMAYLAGEPELALKTLTRKLLDRDPVDYPGNLEDLPLDLGARYACADTRNTYDLYWRLKKRLEDSEQWAVYEQIERPLVPVIASMERYGSPLDVGELQRLHTEIEHTEQAIRSLAWSRWHRDVSSDDDTRALITDLLGYDPGTLDQRRLSLIPDPWMDVVLGYRKLRTLRRNFLARYMKRWEDEDCPADFRLYASFNQAGRSDSLTGKSFKRAPRTGRLSSSNPNLMQVPREVRSVFTAPEGYSFWALDFSQLEIRLAAGLSNDPVMVGELQKPGGDIHGLMRQRILDDLGVDVGRPVAKQANFNLRYGGSADMLQTIVAKERAFLDRQVAEAIVDIDRRTYSGYWQWYERTLALARSRGYSETMKGRRVYYDELNSPDPYLRSHAERAAANLVIQGSASDVVKEAMVRAVPVLRHFGAHLSLQVHDELAGWVPTEHAEEFKKVMTAVMQSVEIPRLPLVVEGGTGRNWAEAK